MRTPQEQIEELSGQRRQLLERADQIDAMITQLQRGPRRTLGSDPRDMPSLEAQASADPQGQRASTRIADEVRRERQNRTPAQEAADSPQAVRQPPMTIQRKEELFKVAMGAAAQIGMNSNSSEEAHFVLALVGMLLS